MNKYGAQAMRHWKTHAPERYRLIEKPTRFFTELGLEAQGQISELARRIETNRPLLALLTLPWVFWRAVDEGTPLSA